MFLSDDCRNLSRNWRCFNSVSIIKVSLPDATAHRFLPLYVRLKLFVNSIGWRLSIILFFILSPKITYHRLIYICLKIGEVIFEKIGVVRASIFLISSSLISTPCRLSNRWVIRNRACSLNTMTPSKSKIIALNKCQL